MVSVNSFSSPALGPRAKPRYSIIQVPEASDEEDDDEDETGHHARGRMHSVVVDNRGKRKSAARSSLSRSRGRRAEFEAGTGSSEAAAIIVDANGDLGQPQMVRVSSI